MILFRVTYIWEKEGVVLEKKHIVKITTVIVLFLIVTVCLKFLESSERNMSKEVSVTINDQEIKDGEQSKNITQFTDPLLTEPAQNGADFKAQAAEYMNDVIMAGAELQGGIQEAYNPEPEEWGDNVAQAMSSYKAAITHAMSIPKPNPRLSELYNAYMSILNKYEALPDVVHKAINTNDKELIKVAFSQIRYNEKKYEQLLKMTSQEVFN
jgi:hypothetical protein